MKIQFEASLQGSSCIKFDDDGASMVKLTIDASQLPHVTRLLLMQGKVFRVTVEADGR